MSLQRHVAVTLVLMAFNCFLSNACAQEMVWDHVQDQAATPNGKSYHELYFVNESSQSISVAIHYFDLKVGWTTKGWWTINPGKNVYVANTTMNKFCYCVRSNSKGYAAISKDFSTNWTRVAKQTRYSFAVPNRQETYPFQLYDINATRFVLYKLPIRNQRTKP